MRSLLLGVLTLGFQGAHAILTTSGGDASIPGNPMIVIGDTAGRNVKFKYVGVEPAVNNPPNFIVLAPATGTTPERVRVGLNPLVAGNLEPGRLYVIFVIFSTVDETPVQTARAVLRYTAPAKPTPVVQKVLNTASLRPNLSPGAMVTIFGSDLAAPILTANYDDTASYPLSLGNSTVLIGGIAAPLLYVSPNQINALLPYALLGQQKVDVSIRHFGQASVPVSLNLLETSPGIFTAAQTGTGQAAILQLGPDSSFTYNTLENPAPPGTAFEMFCTGAGVWTPPVAGDISLGLTFFRTQPVDVTIGGKPARVLFAGTPGGQLVWGLLQVNAIVPEGLSPGPQSLVLKIGPNDSSAQRVTIAVQ